MSVLKLNQIQTASGVIMANLNSSGANAGIQLASNLAPAFRVSPSTNQTISHNTLTKVSFGSETFDTNNNFASSTFTPTVAGYYKQNYNLALNVTDGRQYYFLVDIFKNGVSVYQYEFSNAGNAGGRESVTFSDMVYLNGTGDYMEVYLYSYDYTSSGSVAVRSNSSWSSSLARSA